MNESDVNKSRPVEKFLESWRHHATFQAMGSESAIEACCELRDEQGYLGSFCVQICDEHTATLAEIIVDENKRGKGIGSKMLDAICASADVHGINLTTEPDTFGHGFSIFEDNEGLRDW